MEDPLKLLLPANFGWILAKWLLLFVIFSIALAACVGFIVGILTYGRPRKRAQGEGAMDVLSEFFMDLTHGLIDQVLGRSSKGDWMSDQRILSDLRSMKPSEFEEFIASMFRRLGYDAQVMGGSGDGGIDIEMTKDGRQYLVQCKKFITRRVVPHDVRDFYGAIAGRNINGKGFFITTNIFTLDAERFAEGKLLELIDGNRLIQFVRESGIMGTSEQVLIKKTEDKTVSCPRCGGALVTRTNRENGNTFLGCANYPKCRFTRSA